MLKRMAPYLFVWTILSCANATRPETPVQHTAAGYDTLAMGQNIFGSKCSICHGDDGRLGASGAKVLPDTKMGLQEIEWQVRRGKKAMPGFEQTLTDEQITAVAKFVLTLKQ